MEDRAKKTKMERLKREMKIMECSLKLLRPEDLTV